jgi:hypothetical protein
MSSYLIKTKNGEYAAQDSDLGLKTSWTTDEKRAFRFTEERAAFWMRRLNAYSPGHAEMVPVS